MAAQHLFRDLVRPIAVDCKNSLKGKKNICRLFRCFEQIPKILVVRIVVCSSVIRGAKHPWEYFQLPWKKVLDIV